MMKNRYLPDSHLQTEKALKKVLEAGVADRLFPGAVALISHRQSMPICVATGTFTYDEGAPSVKPDTLFDLASLTKVIVTTTAVLQIVAKNRLSLSESVSQYLDPFCKKDKETITLLHLLTHTSGLRADLDYKRCATANDLWEMIYQEPLLSPPGTSYVYSDLGFLLLGCIVEIVSGETLDTYAGTHIFEPLGMARTMYTPPQNRWSDTAPTEYDNQWRGRLLQGQVHDEKAFLLGGVAGHAGLFSTAFDLCHFMRSLLDCISYNAPFVLPREYAQLMVCNQTDALPIQQGLGWALDQSFLGELRPDSFGHTGFTGVSIAASPVHSLICIILTNCVYPTRPNTAGRQQLKELRAEIASVALRSITR